MISSLRKKELPLAPVEIRISSTTPSALEFEWIPPSNATKELPIFGYEICYQVEIFTALNMANHSQN
jgi:hypothetical protein